MPLTEDTKLRRCIFRPYRKGAGPVFVLVTWDANRREYGKWMLGYRLTMIEPCDAEFNRRPTRTVLFEGEDVGCAPSHAVDSDAACEAIMSFLTLRPGDTDREYFEGYTSEQLDFCSLHAEALAGEVESRFGERPRTR